GLAVDLLRSNQALVGEGHQAIEDLDAVELAGRSADGLGRVELAASDEDRQPSQEPPLPGVEHVVGPRNSPTPRLLALRQVARAGREDAELVLQAFEDRVGCEE